MSCSCSGQLDELDYEAEIAVSLLICYLATTVKWTRSADFRNSLVKCAARLQLVQPRGLHANDIFAFCLSRIRSLNFKHNVHHHNGSIWWRG